MGKTSMRKGKKQAHGEDLHLGCHVLPLIQWKGHLLSITLCKEKAYDTFLIGSSQGLTPPPVRARCLLHSQLSKR